jgi:predicted regulator of Ras-like GTPase activity (Roadblock/LC7/MglB family)
MSNAGYGVAPAQPPAQAAPPPPPPPAPGQPAGPGPQISPVQSAGPGAGAAPQKPASAGLFSIDDSVIDKIFSDNLGVTDGSNKNAGGADPNANVAPPQKIEGVGRLDSRVDHNQDAGTGRISSIGKFLLDQKDMEKLSKLNTADLSDSSMRILTQEAAGELTTLLHHIAGQNAAVIGSVIVGHDGLLIANTMPPEIEAESAGVWALGVYMNTAHVVKKMGQNRVHQIVSKTPKGYLVIADFGGGLLVVLSDGKDTDTLIPLMRSITQLVVQ